MKRIYPSICLAILIGFLSACGVQTLRPQSQQSIDLSQYQTYLGQVENVNLAIGQVIYVPVYSHVYYLDRQKPYNLAANLSIRNTDLTNPITIASVRYYDTNGKLVREYPGLPLKLGALASTDFFVAEKDTSGGIGANFIVEWIAQKQVSEPIVEVVSIGTSGTQGISFISPGKVIQIKTANSEEGD